MRTILAGTSTVFVICSEHKSPVEKAAEEKMAPRVMGKMRNRFREQSFFR
jgi:hypothetical protein